MVKRAKGLLGCLTLLTMLTACSAEELLDAVPGTVQLEEAYEAVEPDSFKEAVEPVVLSEEAYLYAYKFLDAAEQLWYDDMAAAMSNMEEVVKLSEEGLKAGLDADCIDRIFQCVLNDHPELFYVSGYNYTKYYRGDVVVAIEFAGKYEWEPEEIASRRREIEQAAADILAQIDGQASDYDKVKYVYEVIVGETEYDLEAPDNQNIYSVFAGHRSVCQGYAKAAQYLLNSLGVPCTLVQGRIGSQGHAWNLVQIDGSYYYMDVTWGDASYALDGENAEYRQAAPEINYDYLCITTEQLLRTHVTDNCVPMPECVDTKANYYVREGACFEAYDAERMQRLVQRAQEAGRKDVAVKCSDEACYQEMQKRLIEEQGIFDCLSDEDGTIMYVTNDELLTLSFWVTN